MVHGGTGSQIATSTSSPLSTTRFPKELDDAGRLAHGTVSTVSPSMSSVKPFRSPEDSLGDRPVIIGELSEHDHELVLSFIDALVTKTLASGLS